MSNLINIDELRKKFVEKKSIEDWQVFAEEQYKIIQNLSVMLDNLNKKNEHLEKMLLSSSDLMIKPLDPEENICIHQISRLEEVSNQRPLTLEEVKKLDLLVKNLKLIREGNTITVNNKTDLPEEDLVALVKAEKPSDS